jgi:hypothetical protein
MQTIAALIVLTAGLTAGAPAFADEFAGRHVAQANPGRLCAQVISCGSKDGKRKEYPTPCAAQDDGATNIAPKTGPTCDESK